eukprot:4320758-Pleurochrysis_carterae.AAC.7
MLWFHTSHGSVLTFAEIVEETMLANTNAHLELSTDMNCKYSRNHERMGYFSMAVQNILPRERVPSERSRAVGSMLAHHLGRIPSH